MRASQYADAVKTLDELDTSEAGILIQTIIRSVQNGRYNSSPERLSWLNRRGTNPLRS